MNEDAVRCVYWLNNGQINWRVGIRWEYYPHKRYKNWLKFVEGVRGAEKKFSKIEPK